MSDAAIIFFLSLCVLLLLSNVLYQQFAFRTRTQADLRKIHQKLKAIMDTDSDERVMLFTENKDLMELAAQINRLLEKHLKVKADYRHSEMASKRMLSNISHDMKTPMTVVLGYLEIMRLNGETAPEILEKTEQKAQSVMDLIDRFFTLAKLEAGDADLELSKVDLCEICRESVLDFYEILTKAEFQVEIDLPEKPVFVMGNEEALQRVLCNLISNAIRYGAAGKYLGISLRIEENQVCIDVADKGKGIEKSFAESVFDRLFTMEDSRNRDIQGNGLGLAIVKNLVGQLGGEILLDSVPHVKTTFTVKLPRASARGSKEAMI